jgi:hypothetical protein
MTPLGNGYSRVFALVHTLKNSPQEKPESKKEALMHSVPGTRGADRRALPASLQQLHRRTEIPVTP